MTRCWSNRVFAAVAAVLAVVGQGHGETSFKLSGFGGAVLLPDQQTLVVSDPTTANLIYIDTVGEKESKRVEVEFKPGALAVQGDKLYAAAQGSTKVHVLEAATGKDLKTITVPGAALGSLGCHPAKGLLYGVDTSGSVFSIDPAQGTATKTKAKGQMLAVDAASGEFVYTGIQKPIKDVLVIQRQGGGGARVSLAKANRQALMLKYEVKGPDLELAAANDNAAINGASMGLSPDGKKIAMAGGGGMEIEGRRNYAIAVFSTSDLKDQLGLVETGPYPTLVAFHPLLSLGAACKRGGATEILIFNAKTFTIKQTIPAGKNFPAYVGFGGKGTKVIFAERPLGKPECVVKLFPLTLTDQDREALGKSSAK